MKRCFSLALILALVGSTGLSPALAEEFEVVSENVEAAVAPAEQAEGTGLTVDGEWDFAPEQTPTQADEESADIFADEAIARPFASAISLSQSAVTIGVKEVYSGLCAVPQPEGSRLPAVAWRSGNKKYVKVNAATGEITGVRKGSANVYAKIEGGKEVKCKVTVLEAPKKVTVSASKMTLTPGMTAPLEADVPKGSASARFTFTCNKPGIAAVDGEGNITALAPGSATVTVKAFNGKKAKCKITVLEAPAAVAFPADHMTLAVGQTDALEAEALDAGGDEVPAYISYSVDPTSPDPDCVRVDAEEGEVTGLRKGQAYVLAATQNGMLARCLVTVAPAPKAVLLTSSSISIGLKEIYTGLHAETVAPDGEDFCADAVAWSSSNKKVAVVDAETGAITGLKKGSCTITVQTPNGKSANCKVTVKKAPSSISLSPKNGVLSVGTSGTYKVSLSDGSAGAYRFASSDESIAVIDENGTITGIAPGIVTVTVTAYNGKKATGSLLVKGAKSSPTDNDGGKESEVTEYKAGMSNAEKLEYVIHVAETKLGCPYVYGSFGPNSFDCSGFTTYCFRQINVELKHSAYTQGYDNSLKQLTMAQLRRGDLVYFDTVSDSDLSDHAGIYMGGGKFIHASSSGGQVIISTLASGYYNRVFSWGRRALDD